MIIQKFTKGNRRLELHRLLGCETDDDGRLVEMEYWECRINDGRTIPFAVYAIAVMFIQQNLWTEVADFDTDL